MAKNLQNYRKRRHEYTVSCSCIWEVVPTTIPTDLEVNFMPYGKDFSHRGNGLMRLHFHCQRSRPLKCSCLTRKGFEQTGNCASARASYLLDPRLSISTFEGFNKLNRAVQAVFVRVDFPRIRKCMHVMRCAFIASMACSASGMSRYYENNKED